MDMMDYSFLVGIHKIEHGNVMIPNSNSKPSSISCFNSDEGGIASNSKSEIYYIGIIDILQEYCLRKIAEHAYLCVRHNGNEVSAVPPDQYGERFLSFLSRHIV
jgi:1-phosphatidylinositol-4-phosphate 5-kinase